MPHNPEHDPFRIRPFLFDRGSDYQDLMSEMGRGGIVVPFIDSPIEAQTVSFPRENTSALQRRIRELSGLHADAAEEDAAITREAARRAARGVLTNVAGPALFKALTGAPTNTGVAESTARMNQMVDEALASHRTSARTGALAPAQGEVQAQTVQTETDRVNRDLAVQEMMTNLGLEQQAAQQNIQQQQQNLNRAFDATRLVNEMEFRDYLGDKDINAAKERLGTQLQGALDQINLRYDREMELAELKSKKSLLSSSAQAEAEAVGKHYELAGKLKQLTDQLYNPDTKELDPRRFKSKTMMNFSRANFFNDVVSTANDLDEYIGFIEANPNSQIDKSELDEMKRLANYARRILVSDKAENEGFVTIRDNVLPEILEDMASIANNPFGRSDAASPSETPSPTRATERRTVDSILFGDSPILGGGRNR